MAAQLIPPGAPEFRTRFTAFSYSVFRLETLQNYGNSGEDAAVAAFLADEPAPHEPAIEEWDAMIRRNAQAGRIQQRVHVITEPLTDYMRFELNGYAQSVDAGEEVRIVRVAENEPWPSDVPKSDYFLFDSSELYWQHYDDAGEWLGTEPITDPAAIVRACRWRDAALYRATPWWDYLRNHHPELVQRVVALPRASGRR
ncbi:MAG: DUF6879 family protein [Pseudonocardiaceae bacterium]